MATTPTRGATEDQTWKARKGLAIVVRALTFVIPIVVSMGVLRLIGHLLYRPPGWPGLALWVAQAAPISALVAYLVDRTTRRALPLATLLELSLVFPDQAPSRFSTALRAGTVRKLSKAVEEATTVGLGDTANEAAANALELVALLGDHDRLTRGHSERVRAYADLIAEELGLSDEDRLRLAWGVILHDMGKLTVPEEVLNKKDKLTNEEWELLKGHPAAGVEMLAPLADWLGDWVLAASEHHERWDGDGYPYGLAGTDISLAGRITSVADAYDVITSKRSYKKAMSTEAARNELVACAGGQFDPEIVRAFVSVSLGKRWTFGPLAWLADLPIGQIGSAAAQAPVVALTGAVVAVSTGVALPPEPVVVEGPLAFVVETTTPVQIEEEVLLEITTALQEANDEESPLATVLIPTTIAPTSTGLSPTSSSTTTANESSTTQTTSPATTIQSSTIKQTTTTQKATTTASAPTSQKATTTTVTTVASTTTPTTVPTTSTTIATTTTTVATTTTTLPGIVYGGHRYVTGTPGLTWLDARAEAQALGGYLVSITSSGENNFVATNFGGDRPVWLGFSDTATEDTYVWESGESFSYTKWIQADSKQAGEPNSGPDTQDYGAMVGSDGAWDDQENFNYAPAIYVPNVGWQGVGYGVVTLIEFNS